MRVRNVEVSLLNFLCVYSNSLSFPLCLSPQDDLKAELSAFRLSSGWGVQVSVDNSVPTNKTTSPCAHRFLLHCHLATRVCVCEVFETFASLAGSELCEHNRIRTQCKDCGGPGICVHRRIKRQCKECGGSSICEHKRQR